MKAAVLTANDTPLETRDDIEIAPPGPGEVRVRVVASGVCHSDLSVLNGTIPLPTPIVLGHEGAGVVEEIGDGVSKVSVGDHVVLSFKLDALPQKLPRTYTLREEAYRESKAIGAEAIAAIRLQVCTGV